MGLSQSALYQLLIREDKATWGRIVFAAVAAGLMQGAIVVILNEAAGALSTGGAALTNRALFLLVLAAYSLASHYATSRTVALTESTIFSTYAGIADRLRRMRLLDFERLGKARIYAILHTSTDIILETGKSLASVAVACVMILFCGAYIGHLSGTALVTVAVLYAFGVFVYTVSLGNVQGLLREAGRREQRFRGLFAALLEGFKEIKVHHDRSTDLVDHAIRPEGWQAREARVRAEGRLTANGVFVQSYYYVLVAAMIFLLPWFGDVSHGVILQVAVVVLFSYGSATRIVQSIPLILKAERAVEAIRALERDLDAARDPAGPYTGRFAALPPGERGLRLDAVRFDYERDGQGSHFSLGPLSLDVHPGELLFIAGGNGTGKTTLLKLLAGLYSPREGTLYLGAIRIDDDNAADYRNLFAVLFPDYHLFDRFYGQPHLDEARLRQALRTMGLEGHVQWADGRFGELHLSRGQRKRLALICADLDDRPILVLDEVAADLDPDFRRFFYEDYLPRLRAGGKTIIAVSHDEMYFHVADRVIRLDAGRVAP